MNRIADLLRRFELRPTPGRQAILQLFLKKSFALAHSDIEKNVPSHFDRVTVYRTLKTFLDKGLIHKVLDDEASLKYALCNAACTEAAHHHDHVHFKCLRCNQTSCLEVSIPAIKLPRGYKASDINLLIEGVCENCQSPAR